MKKIILSIILFTVGNVCYAQKDSLANDIAIKSAAIGHSGNNEIKVNVFYLVLGLPEVSYERIIADNMGVGLSTIVAFEDDQDMKYGLIASYRLYFGSKKANGFFIEGNMGVIAEEEGSYYYVPETNNFYQGGNITTAYFGLGAAAGAKFLTRNGLLGEAYLGAGRLLSDRSSGYYPRVGVTIGKRF